MGYSKRRVKSSVDKGIPLVWSVYFCSPWDGGSSFGIGHLRLIVGYNEEKNEIIYSDTWGLKHKYKHAPLHEAFIVTSFCTCLVPCESEPEGG